MAKRFAATLLVISLLLAYGLDTKFSLVCLGYAGLMIGYSVYLKKVAILEVIIIAMGFVSRAVAGAVVIDVVVSPWLLVCTLFLSLFLVLSKRRHELVLLGAEANHHRHSLLPSLLAGRSQVMPEASILLSTEPKVVQGILSGSMTSAPIVHGANQRMSFSFPSGR